ncbi:MAG: hypothetical protein HY051_00355 [Candidatus Aenigmarchaeota archaeon]|nr:hypothetical protein [Candidatus Aenigmarchaeota archaeon]
MNDKDIPELIYKKFGVYFSNKTINEFLASLEKNKLIKGAIAKKEKIYSITENGKKAIKVTGKLLKELGL